MIPSVRIAVKALTYSPAEVRNAFFKWVDAPTKSHAMDLITSCTGHGQAIDTAFAAVDPAAAVYWTSGQGMRVLRVALENHAGVRAALAADEVDMALSRFSAAAQGGRHRSYHSSHRSRAGVIGCLV